MNSTLGEQTKHKISKVYSVLCVSYNVKFTTSEVMQTSDGPTNPRTWRVLKNRQVNSGSFTPHTVSPMQYLQAVIVINSKALRLLFWRARELTLFAHSNVGQTRP